MRQEHISIVLADEHPLYREALAVSLRQSSQIRVIGQSSTGPQAEELFRSLRPDILVIDVTMHTSKGFETSDSILRWDPGARIIWLSTFLRESYYKRAHESGIKGYLAKSMSFAQMLEAIWAVYHGQSYLSRQ